MVTSILYNSSMIWVKDNLSIQLPTSTYKPNHRQLDHSDHTHCSQLTAELKVKRDAALSRIQWIQACSNSRTMSNLRGKIRSCSRKSIPLLLVRWEVLDRTEFLKTVNESYLRSESPLQSTQMLPRFIVGPPLCRNGTSLLRNLLVEWGFNLSYYSLLCQCTSEFFQSDLYDDIDCRV